MHISSSPHERPCFLLFLYAVCYWLCFVYSGTADAMDTWPAPPIRTGLHLPDARQLAVRIGATGAYIPQRRTLSAGDTFTVGNVSCWNFSITQTLGLVGQHSIATMGWANVRLLTTGHEIGIRFRPRHWLAIEGMFLSHRTPTTRVDDLKLYPGGVQDTGAEAITWFRYAPVRTIRIELGIGGRYFAVYTENHIVLHSGARLAMLPFDGHSIEITARFLEVWRLNRRIGSDRFTHNTIGKLRWNATVTSRTGIFVALMISTNLLVGDIPMLELKRTMVGEPMGHAGIGFFGLL